VIASVRGTVLTVRLDSVVVEVGGVGLLVMSTPAVLTELRPGMTATLHTSLVVREDSLTLFGFADADGRDTFETLQTVTGVGPRLALAMLAVHTPDGLRRAVAGADLTALMKVPGVGRKGAQRLALELGDKLGAPAPLSQGADAAVPTGGVSDAAGQVVEALVGLGWSSKQAGDAVDAVLARLDASGDATASVPAVLRAALRHLGGTA
jgi:Holliday junction DNA helicase RuvA